MKLLLLVFAVALAGVFAYYPWQVVIQPTEPPVIFEEGSNADQPDLNNKISVELGANRASAKITVHPSYHVTYYKDVIRIKNNGGNAYYISIRVENVHGSLPSGSVARLYIYSSGAQRSLSGFPSGNQPPYNEAQPTPSPESYLAEVDLTKTGTVTIGELSGGGSWEVDVYVYIPEGSSIKGMQLTASLYLIVSPSDETPP